MGQSRPLRIVFAGTPRFAELALEAILAAGHHVVLVLTRVDKPAGRGRAVQESPVKQLARQRGLPIEQPRTLRDEALQAKLRALDADVMVVAAYGLILPAEVLRVPRHGCLNIHASLLPRWRGAAPIQRAIEAGDASTGVTIMQMDEGLDTGDMLLAQALPIAADDTAATLHDRLAALGARLVVQALRDAAAGTLRRTPQPPEGVTYARKIDRREARVDWRADAAQIARRVRAFDPAPGLHFELDGESVKLWRAAPRDDLPPAPAGTVLVAGGGRLVVACGRGALELVELQRPGGRRVGAAAFLQSRAPTPGSRLPPAGGD